jgi:leucyl-tRNA synthetase
LTKEEIAKEILAKEEVIKLLDGKIPKNIIVVPNRIVNIVV